MKVQICVAELEMGRDRESLVILDHLWGCCTCFDIFLLVELMIYTGIMYN